MKEVGLVTCFVNNYGACLQAYALQKAIKDLGHDVEIVDYSPVFDVKRKRFFEWFFYEAREIYRCLRYKNYVYEHKCKKYFSKFRNKFLSFSKYNCKNDDSALLRLSMYEKVVVGSDQLWNPLIHKNRNNRVYFLDFKDRTDGHCTRRIAYAPSVGIACFPSKDIEDDARKMLLKFDVLSCREYTGAKMISQITGKSCRAVLDPTLLISREEWEKIAGKRIIKNDYIFIYRFGTSKEEEEIILNFAKKVNLPIVCLPMAHSDFESKSIIANPCGPSEFVNYIMNASFVLTDSFHATAFSINMGKNFACLLRCKDHEKNNMNSRIMDILDKMKLTDRLINNADSLELAYKTPINFQEVKDLLLKERKLDILFLKNSIEGNE